MKKRILSVVFSLIAAALLSGCGGGGGDDLPAGGVNLLAYQVSECAFAGKDATRFNKIAAILQTSDVLPICAAWIQNGGALCELLYATYSKPYAGKCL